MTGLPRNRSNCCKSAPTYKERAKEHLKAAFVINRKIANTAIGRDVVKALKQYPQPVLHSSVCQRVAFAESARGRTVLEIDHDSAASKEIQSLAKEVLKLAS